MKRLFSIISTMFLMACMLFVAGCGPSNTPQNPTGDDFVYELSADGKYIYFGEYPQTIKANNVSISGSPDQDGYYQGSDGARYAKVTLDILTSFGENPDYVYENDLTLTSRGSEMLDGQTYYFKVEKLKWRILEEDDGALLIICESAVDTSVFQDSICGDEGSGWYVSDGQGGVLQQDGKDVDANNYEYSTLRTFLNGDFCDKSFSQKQKDMIILTTLDNSKDGSIGDIDFFGCKDTEDYIFPLSYDEIYKEEYGYIFDYFDGDQPLNYAKATDYAKSKGCWSSYEDGYESADVFLRTGIMQNSYAAAYCFGGTFASAVYIINGVQPALWLKL